MTGKDVIQNELLNILKEIRKWVKFLGWSNVKTILIETLSSEREVLIYHLSDGDRSIRDIISEVTKYNLKASYGGIHGMWQRWKKVGIVEPSLKYSGRFQKIFDVEEFGIELLKREQVNNEENKAGNNLEL